MGESRNTYTVLVGRPEGKRPLGRRRRRRWEDNIKNGFEGEIVRNGNIKTVNLSFEKVRKFKYLGATVTNINGTRDEIKRRINIRLRWAGHVARTGNTRNAYRMFVWRTDGKRPSGRPRLRWEDNIKMDLREVGYDGRDWINLAEDRDRWRAYVRAAMNLKAISTTLTMKAFVMFFVAMSVVAAVCLAMPSPGEPKVEEFSESLRGFHWCSQTVLARARRSPMPGDKDKPRAHVGAKINEESGVGVKAQVNGRGTLYESDDGRSRVNVEGQWSKVLDGPQRGKPQHKAGISWEWDSD
ncbi:hypothetical protein ANN_25621 [Periplaneta americana]|uniref:Uncharacterized protein n=1 Tax=Periplaneta americana TaxID=6978 RepID=A0ABQ8S1I5_PERAM|nr:hypothetical protein ANN_25621 [Periplaneta americana]